MKPPEGQLEIDVEVHAHLTGTVRSPESEVTAPPPPETTTSAPSAEAATVPEFEQVQLPGTDPDVRPRTSEKIGAELRLQTDYYLHQLETRGTEWLLDREARQWLDDLEVVRVRLREVEHRLFARGGATEDGLYAEVIERIVGKRAKPAYLGETVAELDELFDPHCLIVEKLAEQPARGAAESDGDRNAARQAAKPARIRAKVAVARARVFDRHPEWRADLAARFS